MRKWSLMSVARRTKHAMLVAGKRQRRSWVMVREAADSTWRIRMKAAQAGMKVDGLRRGLGGVRAVWGPATWVNLAAMTLYLWHLPVLVAVTTLAHTLSLDRPVRLGDDGWPVPDGWGYLLGSLVLWTVYAVGVWAVVRLMWPFEHAPLVWWDAPPRSTAPSLRAATWVAALGCVGVGVSTLVLSGTGLAGFPWRIVDYAGLPLSAAGAIVALLVSGLAIRWAGAPRR